MLLETSFEVDIAREAAFDTWLRDHVADVMQIPGFLSARILGAQTLDSGRVQRLVQFSVRDVAAIDDYQTQYAQQLEVRGRQLFGADLRMQRRPLQLREEFVRGAVSTENCRNCGEVLTGQHCAQCGQRAQVRVLSLWSLLREVTGNLLDLDSRIWRTLWPLAFAPGRLTQEYLRGRRTAYTPPFRMYLLLSIAFFLAAALNGGAQEQFDIDGVGSGEAPSNEQAADIDAPPVGAGAPSTAGFSVEDCGPETFRIDFVGPQGERYESLLRETCRKVAGDATGFGRALYQNLPRMMFIFLPLVAALMTLLYLGSGRFYVEHLLFFVHFHAFCFLGGLLATLLGALAVALDGVAAANVFSAASNVTAAVLLPYVPWYLYRGMRVVYGEGRGVTLAKFVLLGVGYCVFLLLTGLGLLAYTALSL